MGFGQKEPHLVEAGDELTEKQRLRRESLDKIRFFRLKSVRGAWSVSAFLLVSIGALIDFRFLPSLPEKMKAMLGTPPSALMISGLLVLYTFSAIILVLSKMMRGAEPSGGIVHVIYLSAFYGFYHLDGALDDNFWAVFAAGLTVLGLLCYHNRIRFNALVREEQEILRIMDDDGKGPGGRRAPFGKRHE